VLGRVAGGGQRPEHQPAQVDLLAVLQAAVAEAQPAGSGREDLGAGGGQFPAAGQEVGVQMGLHGPFVDNRVNGGHGRLLRWIRGQVGVTARPAARHSGSPSSSRRAERPASRRMATASWAKAQ
jgi:hypothetical protein